MPSKSKLKTRLPQKNFAVTVHSVYPLIQNDRIVQAIGGDVARQVGAPEYNPAQGH
jgi:hypothetical protein